MLAYLDGSIFDRLHHVSSSASSAGLHVARLVGMTLNTRLGNVFTWSDNISGSTTSSRIIVGRNMSGGIKLVRGYPK